MHAEPNFARSRRWQAVAKVGFACLSVVAMTIAGMQVAHAESSNPEATELEGLAESVAPEMSGADADFALVRGEATTSSASSAAAVSTDSGAAVVELTRNGTSVALVEVTALDVDAAGGVDRAANGSAVVVSEHTQSLVVEHTTEQLRLQVVLPADEGSVESRFDFADSELELQSDGTVEVWREFADAPGLLFNVGHVEPAWAFAADGSEVPTGYAVEGSTLVQWIDASSAGDQAVVADPTFLVRNGQLTFKLNRSETVDWYRNRGNYAWIVAVCAAGLAAAASVGGPWGAAFGAVSGGIWCGVNYANISNNLGYAYRAGTCFRLYTSWGIQVGTMRC